MKLEVYDGHEQYTFPTSLYNCGTLETLKLYCDVLVDVPFPVCLKSLRTLFLYEVRFQDDESVVNLLSGCSSLENLEVRGHSFSDLKTFTVDVPSLQRLTLTSENESENCFTEYVINAPSLKHLEINGVMEDDSACLIENMPELVEAHINVCGVIYENIHGSLTSVKRLFLDITSPLDLTKFPTNIIFKQLVYLELHTYEPEWWYLFMLMLDSSPNLQVLKLFSYWVRDGPDRDLVAYKRWTQPNYAPECLLNCLETLVWENYQGEMEDEKEVAQYILRNASRLKTATFSRTDVHPVKNLEMFRELARVVRASNSCQLVFKETDILRKYYKLITFLGL